MSYIDLSHVSKSLFERARGCMIGAAIGDAVGAFLEWKWAPVPECEIKEALSLGGGGPHMLAPGKITDDTEQALCLAAGLIKVKYATKSDNAPLSQQKKDYYFSLFAQP